jgi:hypothetical protein
LERLLFSVLIIGLLMAGYGVLRYLDLSNQLSGNMAARIHEEGGEVALEDKAQAQGLMAADLARRRLLSEQNHMMIVGGVGLALLGLGWLGTDLLGSRRRKAASANPDAISIPS